MFAAGKQYYTTERLVLDAVSAFMATVDCEQLALYVSNDLEILQFGTDVKICCSMINYLLFK